MPPNDQAKLILNISYERAVENSILQNASKDFLREFIDKRKTLFEQYAKDQDRRILEWSESAKIRKINGTHLLIILIWQPALPSDII